MISVVHPAYHWLPNGGQGSFCELGKRRLSCVRVFATGMTGCQRGMVVVEAVSRVTDAHSAGYVMAIVNRRSVVDRKYKGSCLEEGPLGQTDLSRPLQQ